MADFGTGTEQGVSNASYEMYIIAPDVVPTPDEPSEPPSMTADPQEPPSTLNDLQIPPPPDDLPPPLQSEEEIFVSVNGADMDDSEPAVSRDEPLAPPAPEYSAGVESPQIGNGEVSSAIDVTHEMENASKEDDIAAMAQENETIIEMKDEDNTDNPEAPSPSSAPSTSASDSGSGIHNASTLPSTKPIFVSKDEEHMVNGNYEMTPEETKAAMKMVNKYRRESISWIIIFILATGLIAVIFYFTYSILAVRIDPIPEGPFHFRVIVQLRNEWMQGLEVSSDPLHMVISGNLIRGVDDTFTSDTSTFADVYQRAEVVSFTRGNNENVRAFFRCFFSGAPRHLMDQESFNVSFEAELRKGFEDGMFAALELLTGEPITVVGYTSTETSTPATAA